MNWSQEYHKMLSHVHALLADKDNSEQAKKILEYGLNQTWLNRLCEERFKDGVWVLFEFQGQPSCQEFVRLYMASIGMLPDLPAETRIVVGTLANWCN
jgi:hypothetical protein